MIGLLIHSAWHYIYKLVIILGGKTGDTEFVIFGWIAQRLIKRTADTLIANNPPGFIPDEIIRLLEKVFTFNVSFIEKTIASGTVSFQVNTIVADIDDGNPLLITPLGCKQQCARHTRERYPCIKNHTHGT
jgi:hypothetical protein